MAESSLSTLNSRMRVLIAKTFRAEKLYSSLLNVSDSSHNTTSGPVGAAVLTKLANDVRAREWQTSHEQLRASLNDLVKMSSSSAALDRLQILYEQYYARFVESGTALDRGISALVDTARRQEFAHVMKLSVEMTRHKARAQACKVIADELAALIGESGRNCNQPESRDSDRLPTGVEVASLSPEGAGSINPQKGQLRRPVEPDDLGGKIIPLRRRGAHEPSSRHN